MKPLILLLSTYPIKYPQHGGQIRLAQIATAYREAGWQVEHIAIYSPEGYKKEVVGQKDIPFPTDPPWRYFNGRTVPFIDDLLIGIYAISDEGGFPQVLKRLPKNIDAIHVEQPWLWPLAKRIKSSSSIKDIILIYGSQNIEAPLKKEILISFNINKIGDVLVAIESLEKQAARESDLCFAVTETDRITLLKYGANRVFLAPNGIKPWYARQDDLEEWRKRLPTVPWILYVASAHPPNFTSFVEVIGDSLGVIPPNSRFVVAGTVSEHIFRIVSETKWSVLNKSRLQLLFALPDNDLAAVKDLAHAFVIPILHGGGSNLKTAEAIYSGAYVIGTTSAFRGYEKYIDLPEVIIADTPYQFRSAVRDVLQRPPRPKGEQKDELRQTLLWERCLAPMPENAILMIGNGYDK